MPGVGGAAWGGSGGRSLGGAPTKKPVSSGLRLGPQRNTGGGGSKGPGWSTPSVATPPPGTAAAGAGGGMPGAAPQQFTAGRFSMPAVTGSTITAQRNPDLDKQLQAQRGYTGVVQGAQRDILGATGIRAADIAEGAANRARMSGAAAGRSGGLAERTAGENASRAVASAQAAQAVPLLGMEGAAVGAQMAPIMGQQAGLLQQQQLGLQGAAQANQYNLGVGGLELGQNRLALDAQRAAGQQSLGMGSLQLGQGNLALRQAEALRLQQMSGYPTNTYSYPNSGYPS